jgi:hypothetical protein
VDCSGENDDGQFTSICGQSNNIKLNEWCYFKAPQTGNVYFKTGSDDGSGLWLNDTLIVSDNNGGHGVRWRDSPAQSLISGRYYALEIDWAEHGGSQALYNRWDTTSGDNSNGNIIDSEGYGFYGDEWLIDVTISDNEEIASPDQPILINPEDQYATTDVTPEFQWGNGENTEYSTFLIDDESDLTDGDEWINVSLESPIDEYTITPGNALTEGKWYWKVIANNSHMKNASVTSTLIIDYTPPLTVNLSQPANNTSIDTNNVLFRWNETTDNPVNVSGDESQISHIKCYQLQVDDTSDFSSPLVDDNTSNNQTLQMTKNVAGHLYWRVRAFDV